jgi:hypothetical protein
MLVGTAHHTIQHVKHRRLKLSRVTTMHSSRNLSKGPRQFTCKHPFDEFSSLFLQYPQTLMTIASISQIKSSLLIPLHHKILGVDACCQGLSATWSMHLQMAILSGAYLSCMHKDGSTCPADVAGICTAHICSCRVSTVLTFWPAYLMLAHGRLSVW